MEGRFYLDGKRMFWESVLHRMIGDRDGRGLFHRTFSFIIYRNFAVNYGIFAFMSKFTVKIWPKRQIRNLRIRKVLWNRPQVCVEKQQKVNTISRWERKQRILCKGKYHCTTDPLFDWPKFDQKSKSVVIQRKQCS